MQWLLREVISLLSPERHRESLDMTFQRGSNNHLVIGLEVFKASSPSEVLYSHALPGSLSSGTAQEINEGGEYCSSRGDTLSLPGLFCLSFLSGIFLSNLHRAYAISKFKI